MPGGEIFVGAGVLAMMDTEDQLAIVLGHEMEHVAQNQCRDRLRDELATKHLTVDTSEKLKVEPFLPGYGHDREFTADGKASYSRPGQAIHLKAQFAF